MNHHAYQSREFSDMTRIEMLLKLYAETIGSIELVRDAQEEGDQELYRSSMNRARRLVLGLLSGVNRDYPLGDDIHRLLVFVIGCLGDEKPDLEGALQVLGTLRDAFQEIEERAIELELQGEIPSLKGPMGTMDTQA